MPTPTRSWRPLGAALVALAVPLTPVSSGLAQDEAPAKKKAEKKGDVKPYDEVITEDAVTKAGLFYVHRIDDDVLFEAAQCLGGGDADTYVFVPAGSGDQLVAEQILVGDVRTSILGQDLSDDFQGCFPQLRRRVIEQRNMHAPFRNRHVYLTTQLTRAKATFVIRDEGPGFDTSTLPDPTSPENVDKTNGRGLFLIRTFMDEVRFNDAGNEITMVKRRVV